MIRSTPLFALAFRPFFLFGSLFVVVILAVWDAHDRREALRRDPMTGLLNDAGGEPLLEEIVREAAGRAIRQRSHP